MTKCGHRAECVNLSVCLGDKVGKALSLYRKDVDMNGTEILFSCGLTFVSLLAPLELSTIGSRCKNKRICFQ